MNTGDPHGVLPRELAELERSLRARPRPAPRPESREAVLAALERAHAIDRARERRSVLATAAVTLLFTWGVNGILPDRAPSAPHDALSAQVELTELDEVAWVDLGYAPDKALGLALARRSARITLIAPTVGGGAALDLHGMDG